MSALPAHKVVLAPVLDVFETRCQLRAHLCTEGVMDLHDAVDGMQAYAIKSGLLAELGQDAIQHLMADAFAKVPRMNEAENIIREMIEFFENISGRGRVQTGEVSA